nr:MAG TPA: hypothetical protein [Caudoviricetes sp.]
MRPEKTSGSAVGRGFDSPHLHPRPGISLRFRGFYCDRNGFRPPITPGACIRTRQDVSLTVAQVWRRQWKKMLRHSTSRRRHERPPSFRVDPQEPLGQV